MEERGLVAPITQRSGIGFNDTAAQLERRMGCHLKPTNKSWRVDETYVRVKGL